jgi:outer membrane protein TolC
MGRAAEPLRLEEAVTRALASNPSLTAETAQLRAIEARADREGLPTPYVLGGELENVAGNGTLSGTKSAETTFRISRVLELGGNRRGFEAGRFSFLILAQREAAGTFVAPFEGTHGWYWQNRGSAPIEVQIEVVGFHQDLYRP